MHSGWAVDQAILAEEERLIVIRFSHDWDETCMQMDAVLASVAETIKNFAVIYLVGITEVRLQHHVRAVRSFNSHVLLPQQPHHDRSRNWKQQQDHSTLSKLFTGELERAVVL